MLPAPLRTCGQLTSVQINSAVVFGRAAASRLGAVPGVGAVSKRNHYDNHGHGLEGGLRVDETPYGGVQPHP